MTAQHVENPGENEDEALARIAAEDAEKPRNQGPRESDAEPVKEPEAAGTVDVAEAPAVAEVEGKVIELRTERGSLTLRPGQQELDDFQKASLIAIGIDVEDDPGVVPHVRAFMHMCQIRQLDPWAREAYLIGRGRGDKRKYTMQTGIDGYRKMAGLTGRFIRVKKTLWTGRDDDDRSWIRVEDEDGDVVMKRLWFDHWPADRGEPGSAKVVIEHYDERGRITTTAGQADWGMYAPYNDVWENKPGGGRRPKIGPDGKPVKELGEMWVKGGPHMLAKCAEALADRKAFPATMSGIYVHEEMHRADQDERNREAQQSRARIVEAHQQAITRSEAPAQSSEPVTVGEVAAEVVGAQTNTEPSAGAEAGGGLTVQSPEAPTLLREELEWIATLLKPDHEPERGARLIAARRMSAVKRDLDDFTTEDLLAVVADHRAPAAARLATTDPGAAAAYRDVGRDEVVNLHEDILGEGDDDSNVAGAPVVSGIDPNALHDYVDSGGVCGVDGCGRFEDERPHPRKADPDPDEG